MTAARGGSSVIAAKGGRKSGSNGYSVWAVDVWSIMSVAGLVSLRGARLLSVISMVILSRSTRPAGAKLGPVFHVVFGKKCLNDHQRLERAPTGSCGEPSICSFLIGHTAIISRPALLNRETPPDIVLESLFILDQDTEASLA